MERIGNSIKLHGGKSASKKKGGLGLGSLEEKNAALLYKWRWRFNVERNSLWRRALCDKYKLEEFNLLHENSSANERMSSLWKDIMLVGEGHKYEDIVGSSSWFWVVGYGSKINKVLEGCMVWE